MREEALLKLFQETGALQRGHFQLSSGLHSGVYFQSAIVLQHPDRAEVLGRALARLLASLEPDLAVGPALGGLVISWEVARELDIRGIFTERKGGQMSLRRGFRVEEGDRIVVIEDVVTTGKSTRETIDVLQAEGGDVVGIGSIVDRSGGTIDFGVPFHSLLSLPVDAMPPERCPECAAGVPIEKPGSRSSTSEPA